MKSYLELIPISARVHKRRNRLTIFCIFLSVFLVSVIFGMADMEVRNQKMQTIRQYGNWHVVYGSISRETADVISTRPEIKHQGWYGYLNEECQYTISDQPAVIVGLNENIYRNIFCLDLLEGSYPTTETEVLVSENAKTYLSVKTGDTIKVKAPSGHTLSLTVTGIAEETSQLLSEDSYAVIFNFNGFQSLLPGDSYLSKSDYYLQLTPWCSMPRVIAEIASTNQLSEDQYATNPVLLATLGQSSDSSMIALYGTAVILFLLVLTSSVFMIASSLNSQVLQKTEFFGMLQCLGADKKQIMTYVKKEALHWCKTAIPLGILAGMIVVWVLCWILKYFSPNYFSELPAFSISLPGILTGIAAGLSAVLLSARAPAKKAASVSPLTAVSGNASTHTKFKNHAKTFMLRIDTALGIHHAYSHKKNLFLMTGSFGLSVILFLCFSCTIDFMYHAVKPLKPWTPDFSIIADQNTCSVPKSLAADLAGKDYVLRSYGRSFSYFIPAQIDGENKTIHLVSYEENQMNWAKNFLNEGSVEQLNSSDDYQVLTVYDPAFPLQAGDQMTITTELGDAKVTIAGVLSSSPFQMEENTGTLICSEDTFAKLTGLTDYTIIDLQFRRNVTDENIKEIRSLAGDSFRFSDLRKKNAEIHSMFLAFALFVYGFMAVIALITVCNIINSISMSVSSRMKQYGAMRAVGMEHLQLLKMITAEAFSYSIGGCILGCLIGLPMHRLIFEQMITLRWGDSWQLPYGILAVIIILVLFSTLLAVIGPARRIKNMSIVDTISSL